jgi:2-amino-4-hydroxy-6-hydroxymethyldihydropteridine diphosphokinase
MSMATPEHTAYVGLGSNIENRERYLQQAVSHLNRTPGIKVIASSSVYETDPVGYVEQPPFLNMVVALATTLQPLQLLAAMLEIEKSLGRTREIRWGPRTIDLDLLLYEECTISEQDLTLPHPRMGERAFVLIPLLEVFAKLPDVPRQTVESFSRQLEKLEGKEGVRPWKKTT